MNRDGEAVTAGAPPKGDVGPSLDWHDLYRQARRFAAVACDLDMDPDDLVQDAMEALTAHLGEVDTPVAYLYTTVHNRALELRRRHGARRRRLSSVDLAVPESTTDQYAVELHALVEALAPTDRAVLYLAVVEDWSSAEIAALLNLSDAAVRKRLSRARRRLVRAHTKGGHDANG